MHCIIYNIFRLIAPFYYKYMMVVILLDVYFVLCLSVLLAVRQKATGCHVPASQPATLYIHHHHPS